jgi:hypothetical protein
MMEDCHSGAKPTYTQVLLAGAAAGGVQCSVLCPTELVKCRLQVETDPSKASGLVQCVRDVYRAGGLRGFYAGECVGSGGSVYGWIDLPSPTHPTPTHPNNKPHQALAPS